MVNRTFRNRRRSRVMRFCGPAAADQLLERLVVQGKIAHLLPEATGFHPRTPRTSGARRESEHPAVERRFANPLASAEAIRLRPPAASFRTAITSSSARRRRVPGILWMSINYRPCGKDEPPTRCYLAVVASMSVTLRAATPI